MNTPDDYNAEAVNKPSVEQTTTPPNDAEGKTNHAKNFWQRLNSRRLELHKPTGEPVFGIPLGWSLIILLALIVTRIAFVAAIAFIVLLIMKYQFIVSDNAASKPQADL
jgi:hypothetical protein